MIVRSHALAQFWENYDALPEAIQEQADKQYQLFLENPNHPSLHLKQVGPYWSVRITRGCRALARRRGNEFFWFWIGPHDEYERMLHD